MALLEIVLQSTYVGQECVNRFNYVSTGTPAAVSHSFALASAFGAIWDSVAVPPGYPPNTLFALIRAASIAAVTFDFISVRDVYSNTDFYETPFLQPAPGTLTGEGMSPTQATGFRSNRVRSDIRRGMKRFVGVSETSSGPGGIWTASHVTNVLNPLAAKLAETLNYNDEGNSLSYAPVIVGKERIEPDPPEYPNVRYRYYETLNEQLDHIAAGINWDPYPSVRTQTSRQYGRGR